MNLLADVVGANEGGQRGAQRGDPRHDRLEGSTRGPVSRWMQL